MKPRFDPNQTFHLDAVAFVTGLFDSQPPSAPGQYSQIRVSPWKSGGKIEALPGSQ